MCKAACHRFYYVLCMHLSADTHALRRRQCTMQCVGVFVFVFEHFVGPAGRRAKRSPACLAFVAEEKAPMLITSRHRSSMRGPGRATILQHVSLRMPIQAIYADASWDSVPLSSPPTSLLTWPALFVSPESFRSGLHCLIEHQSIPNPTHHSIPTG